MAVKEMKRIYNIRPNTIFSDWGAQKKVIGDWEDDTVHQYGSSIDGAVFGLVPQLILSVCSSQIAQQVGMETVE